ncbi:MAG TPA: hypothetical protein PLN93_09330 [Vicinamibacterales bacterium]|nr:hypothetical protein [Vicinamibacterales bacterium]HPK72129.1 hypothetical protein [Vicinamibacterales bacterium]
MTAARDPVSGPSRAVVGVLLLLSVVLAAAAYRSLGWRMNGDAATMLYAAFLQRGEGFVLYRDIFDMNAPGAHAVYRGLWAATAGSERALRVADLGIGLGLLAATAAAMRAFGRRSAWAAAVLAGLLYLGSGDALSLQREYFVLVPTALLLALVMPRDEGYGRAGPGVLAAVLAGACAGVASTIKPQAGLLVFVVMAAGFDSRGRTRAWIRIGAAAAAGAAAVWAGVLLWLWRIGALPSFIDIASRYWPLYEALTSRPYGVLSGWDRAAYVAGGYARGLSGARAIWLAAAAAGLIWIRASSGVERLRAAGPLVALAAVTLVFPGASGKFWEYQWLPFGYAMMLLAALVAADGVRLPRWRAAAPAVLLVVAAFLPHRAWTFQPGRQEALARVDGMRAFVAEHLRPGDTVQPLDWTGTALHAMLAARARAATPFLEDVHFYHHAGHPYVQGLRASLVRRLERERPRFILQVDQPGWAASPDAVHPFPTLGALLERDYVAAARGTGWQIFERRSRR